MEILTAFDAVAAVIIAVSAVLAYSRGFVREMLSVLGWVFAGVAAYVLAPYITPYVQGLPYVGSFLGDSCELSVITAFAIVFAVALIIVTIVGAFVTFLSELWALNLLDKGAGFLFGVARGVFLVAIILILNDNLFPSGQAFATIDESTSRRVLADVQQSMVEQFPRDAPKWLEWRYQELMRGCERFLETGGQAT